MRLISLGRQAVVGVAIDDRLGNVGLAPHGVDRDQRIGDFQHFQQLGDGGNLVAFGVDHHLSKADR